MWASIFLALVGNLDVQVQICWSALTCACVASISNANIDVPWLPVIWTLRVRIGELDLPSLCSFGIFLMKTSV